MLLVVVLLLYDKELCIRQGLELVMVFPLHQIYRQGYVAECRVKISNGKLRGKVTAGL
jgi:hypothetical protein